ncbi:hypothetical protein KZ397_03160 [Glaesserella parasuis]|nr:hypothetical protein [Glaesserella parasuis]
MENETVLLILKIIGSLCFWYFVLKYLFKGIKALYQRFIKKQPVDISFETPMSDEEKMKIAQEVSENKQENSIIQKIYTFLLLIISIPFLLITKLIQGICYVLTKHCPKCNSENLERLGSQEIDRWISSKKVQERLASGKTKIKHIQVTKVQIQHNYRCKDCGQLFNETVTREK